MSRVVVGILLLGIGIYVAWEAHGILSWGLFQFAAFGDPNGKVTSLDLQLMNSFVVDLLINVGADTWGELQRYLGVMRVGGIVVAIIGGFTALSEWRRHS